MNHDDFDWLKVLEQDELDEGRVKPVTCAQRTLCMTHFEGQYGALDNRCPHQGGPLGEGEVILEAKVPRDYARDLADLVHRWNLHWRETSKYALCIGHMNDCLFT